jgi:apolipoprotein N-acyltransferase
VPFGEYLPFRKYLYAWLKGVGYFDAEFSAGGKSSLLETDGIKIAPAVCFESTFPFLVSSRVRQGADIILTVTNDAWFKGSSAPQSHFNAGIMRAIENHKYFIMAGNTGISAVIDPSGKVVGKIDQNRRGILTVKIPLP